MPAVLSFPLSCHSREGGNPYFGHRDHKYSLSPAGLHKPKLITFRLLRQIARLLFLSAAGGFSLQVLGLFDFEAFSRRVKK